MVAGRAGGRPGGRAAGLGGWVVGWVVGCGLVYGRWPQNGALPTRSLGGQRAVLGSTGRCPCIFGCKLSHNPTPPPNQPPTHPAPRPPGRPAARPPGRLACRPPGHQNTPGHTHVSSLRSQTYAIQSAVYFPGGKNIFTIEDRTLFGTANKNGHTFLHGFHRLHWLTLRIMFCGEVRCIDRCCQLL